MRLSRFLSIIHEKTYNLHIIYVINNVNNKLQIILCTNCYYGKLILKFKSINNQSINSRNREIEIKSFYKFLNNLLFKTRMYLD